jgi:hypothetical protein
MRLVGNREGLRVDVTFGEKLMVGRLVQGLIRRIRGSAGSAWRSRTVCG